MTHPIDIFMPLGNVGSAISCAKGVVLPANFMQSGQTNPLPKAQPSTAPAKAEKKSVLPWVIGAAAVGAAWWAWSSGALAGLGVAANPSERLTPDITVRGRMPTKQQYATSLRLLQYVAEHSPETPWKLDDEERTVLVALQQQGLVRVRMRGGRDFTWNTFHITDYGKTYLRQRTPAANPEALRAGAKKSEAEEYAQEVLRAYQDDESNRLGGALGSEEYANPYGHDQRARCRGLGLRQRRPLQSVRLSWRERVRGMTEKVRAVSMYRYRGGAAEKRLYGGQGTVTEFWIYFGDEKEPVKMMGHGPTPGQRKTDAIERAKALRGKTMLSNPPSLTSSQSKRRVAELRARGCKVKRVKLPNGDVAVLKECPDDTKEFTNALREVLGLSPLRANPAREWWGPGERWLEQEALKEYRVQKAAHIKRGRSPNTFRYTPPDWQRDAMDALGKNDEERFKAIKLAQIGYPPLRANPDGDNAAAWFALGVLAVAGGVVWLATRPSEAKAATPPALPTPAKCTSFDALSKFKDNIGYHIWYVEAQAAATWQPAELAYASDPKARAYSQVDCSFFRWTGAAWVADGATNAELAAWVKSSTVGHPVNMFLP